MITMIQQIKDPRRKQGKRFELHYILLLSIIAMLSNAKSYRDIATFIEVHYKILKKKFKLKWKDPPSYTTIRRIIQGVDNEELEKIFRKHTDDGIDLKKECVVAIDGKTMRGSFDKYNEQKAIY